MFVTVYADASFNSTNGSGGYGIYMRCDNGVFKRGGYIPRVTNSCAAEMIAILQGIKYAVGTWQDTHAVLVKTDCQAAIHHLLNSTGRFTRYRDEYLSLLREHDISVYLRYVKGHQSDGGVQGWINNECDRLAGKARYRGDRSRGN